MTIWVDAQLSPRTARWIVDNFSVTAEPLRDLGLRDAEDGDIFAAARLAGVIVLTKDSDFVYLLEQQAVHQKSSGSRAVILRKWHCSRFCPGISPPRLICSMAARISLKSDPLRKRSDS